MIDVCEECAYFNPETGKCDNEISTYFMECMRGEQSCSEFEENDE